MRLLQAYPAFIFLLLLHYSVHAQSDTSRQPTIVESHTEKFSLPKLAEHYKSVPLPKQQRSNTSSLDTCATYTFQLQIGSASSDEEITGITTLSSGELLLTGRTNINSGQYDALLIKLDKTGN